MAPAGDILRALEKHEEVRERRELIASLLRRPGVLRARATPEGIEIYLRENDSDSWLKRVFRRFGKAAPDLVIRWSTDQQIRFLMDIAK